VQDKFVWGVAARAKVKYFQDAGSILLCWCYYPDIFYESMMMN